MCTIVVVCLFGFFVYLCIRGAQIMKRDEEYYLNPDNLNVEDEHENPNQLKLHFGDDE